MMDRLKLACDFFVKNDELVNFTEGTYEEITTHADTRSLLFKSAAHDNWKSTPLLSAIPKKNVKGLKQKLVRLYDCNREAYAFQNTDVGNTLNVEEILKSQPVWHGQELSSLDVLDICDKFVNEVIKQHTLFATFAS